ncbi:MAG: DUF1501 domain-containing protein [Paracoccaceae bacterium]
MTNRRDFLKSMTAAASMVGMAGAPKFSFAQEAGQKTFIKVFMRGGADGLHLFPLIGDPFYYTYRPDIAIEPPGTNGIESAVDLGSTMRGMNPNLELLMEIWDSGNMMLAPATSFDPSNRSHFDCQRWIGTGQTRNNVIDGYLNRYMQNVSGPDHPLRGLVAGKTSISTEARGEIQVPAINNTDGFDLRNGDFCEGAGCADNQLTELMREIHSHDIDLSAVEGQVRDNQLLMLDSIAEVQAAGMDYTPSAGGLDYSNSGLGRGLRLCAQLLKAGVPLEVAALDWNIGWDTHSNQISESANRFTDQEKGYHRNMAQGASDFLCFYRDMGAMMNDVVLLCGSEFGRTKKQNGSVGTDHGEGGAWFAFGGPTVRTIADDVTTIDDTVFSRNWLPTVTNYRNIIGEIMVRHMGMEENLVSTIFPNHAFTNYQLFNASA